MIAKSKITNVHGTRAQLCNSQIYTRPKEQKQERKKVEDDDDDDETNDYDDDFPWFPSYMQTYNNRNATKG